MTYPVKVLGFGDNVVDKYEHLKIMYPGGNAVNFAVYAKQFGAERSAYMGIFGSDREAEHVIASLEAEQIELIKCVQVIGENGCSKNTVIDGDRVFLESNEGGVRGDMRYALNRFDLEYIRQFDVVHTGNYCFTERELPKIKAAGVPVSFDFSDDSRILTLKQWLLQSPTHFFHAAIWKLPKFVKSWNGYIRSDHLLSAPPGVRKDVWPLTEVSIMFSRLCRLKKWRIRWGQVTVF